MKCIGLLAGRLVIVEGALFFLESTIEFVGWREAAYKLEIGAACKKARIVNKVSEKVS